jgi:phosphoglycolate phosphatase
MKYNTIFWDFNGTILDDAKLCLSCINHLLAEIEKPILSLPQYKEVFDFPVIKYYEAVGFDFSKHCWETISAKFIKSYGERVLHCPLHHGIKDVLEEFANLNVSHFVLSAMEKNHLNQLLDTYGLSQYFKSISGLDNHYASGKIDCGRQLISSLDDKHDQIVMIGDTIHDAEVAHDLKIDCVLIAQGHQSKERLEKTGVPVLNDLYELAEYLKS